MHPCRIKSLLLLLLFLTKKTQTFEWYLCVTYHFLQNIMPYFNTGKIPTVNFHITSQHNFFWHIHCNENPSYIMNVDIYPIDQNVSYTYFLAKLLRVNVEQKSWNAQKTQKNLETDQRARWPITMGLAGLCNCCVTLSQMTLLACSFLVPAE